VTVPPQAAVLRGGRCWWRAPPHTRRALLYTSCTPLRLLACGWPRTLHPPPVEYLARTPRSHPWLGAPGPRHAIAVHRPTHRRAARAGDTACSTHCRELARLPLSSPPSDPPAPAMRLAVWRAACLRCLEAPLLLASPATSMQHAVPRVAESGLGAPLLLAVLASAVRDAMTRAACRSRAALEQPSVWHRLPPPCAKQRCVLP
jgi:hypothetical protein